MFPVKPHSTAVFCLLCPFPLFEKSTTNFEQSKEKGKVSRHWCLNDKLNWQEGTERRRVSMHMHYAHTLSTTRVQTGSTHERPSPPTLPKHYLTWQITMCESLPVFDIAGICHISVRASRWFHVETKKPKMNPHVILPSLSLSVLSRLSPLGIVEWSRNMEQKSTSHAA